MTPAQSKSGRSSRAPLPRALVVLGVVVAAIAILPGCAALPYRPGQRDTYHRSRGLANRATPQFERGQPRPVIDTLGWVVGIPGKIILWDRRIDNHRVSPKTEQALARYLAINELDDVKVRLNQYSPGDEWRRLVANDSVGAGWRYTFGAFSWLGYTLLPGRVFGGDHFNPFTNTINIYSDVPATALHEGGHAKDWAKRKYKGTYAAVYAIVPGAPLWHERLATRDALGYLRDYGTLAEEREGYRILCPAYGTYVGGAATYVVPGPDIVIKGAAILSGHFFGRVRAARLARERGELPRYPWVEVEPGSREPALATPTERPAEQGPEQNSEPLRQVSLEEPLGPADPTARRGFDFEAPPVD